MMCQMVTDPLSIKRQRETRCLLAVVFLFLVVGYTIQPLEIPPSQMHRSTYSMGAIPCGALVCAKPNGTLVLCNFTTDTGEAGTLQADVGNITMTINGTRLDVDNITTSTTTATTTTAASSSSSSSSSSGIAEAAIINITVSMNDTWIVRDVVDIPPQQQVNCSLSTIGEEWPRVHFRDFISLGGYRPRGYERPVINTLFDRGYAPHFVHWLHHLHEAGFKNNNDLFILVTDEESAAVVQDLGLGHVCMIAQETPITKRMTSWKKAGWLKMQMMDAIVDAGYAILHIEQDVFVFPSHNESAFKMLTQCTADVSCANWECGDINNRCNLGFFRILPTLATRQMLADVCHELSTQADAWDQGLVNNWMNAHPSVTWQRFPVPCQSTGPNQPFDFEQFAVTLGDEIATAQSYEHIVRDKVHNQRLVVHLVGQSTFARLYFFGGIGMYNWAMNDTHGSYAAMDHPLSHIVEEAAIQLQVFLTFAIREDLIPIMPPVHTATTNYACVNGSTQCLEPIWRKFSIRALTTAFPLHKHNSFIFDYDFNHTPHLNITWVVIDPAGTRHVPIPQRVKDAVVVCSQTGPSGICN
jgi:hypothetical protein